MELSEYIHKFYTRTQCVGKDTDKDMENYYRVEDYYFNRFYIDKTILKDKEAMQRFEEMVQQLAPDKDINFLVKLCINDRKQLAVVYLDKKEYTFIKADKLYIKRKKVEKMFNYKILL